ncbi:alpha/beta hydrolase [Sphingomonas histidinilytica]|nr:alpha/beta hydrolase [Rhizorhabdus histidinilytica]
MKDGEYPAMKLLGILAAIAMGLVAASPLAAQEAAPACHVGAYRLTDGSIVDIGKAPGAKLRWRKMDGRTGLLTPGEGGHWRSTLGWTDRPDGKDAVFGACGDSAIRFDGAAGRRLDFDMREARFASGDATLSGRLILPKGAGKVPIVVLVHGSEHDSARDFYALQRLFPAAGIGAFVYDKRGTGTSGGTYTQDYLVLAEDAIAAAREARRLAGDRVGRLGYQAGSQGGWVAPLAAKIEPVDFVIVGFGLAVSPLDEEREAIAEGIKLGGYGPDVVAKALAFAEASIAILSSNFTAGFDRLEAARARYKDEPWFRFVRGDVTHIFLETPEAELRARGPALFAGIPLHHDPMPILRNLDTPQLWMLAADDLDAPSGETSRRLRRLIADGRPITLAVFPRTEHGIFEYELSAGGERLSTRQPETYFRMMTDFVRCGRIDGDYPDIAVAGAQPR